MNGMLFKTYKAVLLSILLVCLSSLASASGSEADPWEGFNRKVYGFNEVVDRYFLRPIAVSYDTVLPDVLQNRVSSFYSNLSEINTIFNDLLQAKFAQAGSDTGRFLVNTTLGLVGFFDVAKNMGLPKSDGEDFGQTLAVWGWDDSRYLVVPFIGPRTITSFVGINVAANIGPISYVDHVPTRNTLYGIDLIQIRDKLLPAEKLITGDKYVFIREAYLQRRNYLNNDGNVVDDFSANDEEFGDDF